jgi:hypothetical protein
MRPRSHWERRAIVSWRYLVPVKWQYSSNSGLSISDRYCGQHYLPVGLVHPLPETHQLQAPRPRPTRGVVVVRNASNRLLIMLALAWKSRQLDLSNILVLEQIRQIAVLSLGGTNDVANDFQASTDNHTYLKALLAKFKHCIDERRSGSHSSGSSS